MIVSVTKGANKIDIKINSNPSFNQLLKSITDKFGAIPSLNKRVFYQYNNDRFFVNDDNTLQKASKIFENRLNLNILQTEEEGGQNHHHFYKFFDEINVIHDKWNKDKWVEKICKSRLSAKNQWKKIQIKYHPQQISEKIIQQIEKHTSQVNRYGHSQDSISAFLMSCFHQQARKKNLNDEQIDKCIWKLDQWRDEKRKLLSRDEKNSVNVQPILLLPSQRKQRFKNNTKPSYFFHSRQQQEANTPNEGQVGSTTSPQADAQYVRYYLFDQIYLHLSKLSIGDVVQKQINKFISKLPFSRQFTDTDLNFATKVLEAFVQYSADGNIYHPPTSLQSGVLPSFKDDEVVAILGDWGTGQADAFSLLQEVVFNQNASIVIHLGDVYYAGFPDQFNRISAKINQLQKQRPNLRYYTIPGNHDYYTYGGPFYQHLANNHPNKKEWNQKESFFCLRNQSNNIQFIGLNTAKNQHSMINPVDLLFQGTYLEEEQVKWAIDQIKNFPGKTILLTHHMLFSAFQSILGPASQFGFKNPQLNSRLAPQLFQIFPKLTCWIWGHEHRFSTFTQNSYGINRCILFGNSSFQNNQQDYYRIRYSANNITDSTFHPPRDSDDYYSHTAIVFNKDLSKSDIQVKYIYMSSSFNQPAIKLAEKQDIISQPNQVQIKYGTIFQMIQESGLSLSFDGKIELSAQPADLQIIHPENINDKGNIDSNANLLIKIQNSSRYLFMNKSGFIEQGNYQNEEATQKKKYLWKIKRQNKSKQPMQTGDIFKLQNAQSGKLIGRQKSFGSIKPASSEKPSRFFFYKRSNIPSNDSSCCNLI